MARALRLLAAALLVLAVAPPGAGAGQATPSPVDYPVTARSTAIVVSATHAPLRVPGSDGLDHLEYDLVISNAFPAPVTLTAIEVITSAGDSLLDLAGDALVAATQPLLGQTPTAAIPYINYNCDSGGTWTSPANPGVSQKGWHVFNIQGKTGSVVSVDKLVNSELPEFHEPNEGSCP